MKTRSLVTILTVLLLAVAGLAQWANPRARNMTLFVGSGLLAQTTLTNNWSVAGPIGGLGGSRITSSYTPLVAGQPAGLWIKFEQHGTATNGLFRFSLTPDGTNFNTAQTIDVFTGVTPSATVSTGGATNGYSIYTNLTAAQLSGAVGILCDSITNLVSWSNITVTVSQPY